MEREVLLTATRFEAILNGPPVRNSRSHYSYCWIFNSTLLFIYMRCPELTTFSTFSYKTISHWQCFSAVTFCACCRPWLELMRCCEMTIISHASNHLAKICLSRFGRFCGSTLTYDGENRPKQDGQIHRRTEGCYDLVKPPGFYAFHLLFSVASDS